MATVIKRKPTSPGRRFVVSVVDNDLHKGKPFAALTESKNRINGRNNRGRLLSDIEVEAISKDIVLLISREIKMISKPLLRELSMTQIEVRILHLFYMPMVSVATLLLLKD